MILSLSTSATGQAQKVETANPPPPEAMKQTSSQMIKLGEDDVIREIVFRLVLRPWVLDSETSSKRYYLAIDGDKDPSESLLKKLSDIKASLKKVSESFISAPDGDIVLDKKTKERGDRFSISKLKWINKDKVQVTAGSYSGNMGSDDCLYTLAKENGIWEIAAKEVCVVS